MDSLGQTDISMGTLAQKGDPAEAILRVAEKRQAGIIVVGNKGMAGVQRFLLGSVPNQVAHHAPCLVFIVRTTWLATTRLAPRTTIHPSHSR